VAHDEQRRYPRAEARIEGFQRIGNRRLRRTVTNVGGGGFFVSQAPPTQQAGDLVVMEFADDAGPFTVTGEVAYLREDGYGVRATRVDWQRLCSLLDRSATPADADR
jgi:hypothetical protein